MAVAIRLPLSDLFLQYVTVFLCSCSGPSFWELISGLQFPSVCLKVSLTCRKRTNIADGFVGIHDNVLFSATEQFKKEPLVVHQSPQVPGQRIRPRRVDYVTMKIFTQLFVC